MYRFYSQEERDERRRRQALGLLLEHDNDGGEQQQVEEATTPHNTTSALHFDSLTPPGRLSLVDYANVDQRVNLMDVETGHYDHVDLDESRRGRWGFSARARSAELPRSSRIGTLTSSWWDQLSQSIAVPSFAARREDEQQQQGGGSSSSSSSEEEEEEDVFQDEELGLNPSKRKKQKKTGKRKGKNKRKKRKSSHEKKQSDSPTQQQEDDERGHHKKKAKHKKKRLRWGRVAMVAAVCFTLMVILFMILILTGQFAWKKLARRRPQGSSNGNDNTTSPTFDLANRNHSILDIATLPESTQVLLHDQIDHTPQDQALQWLQQDHPRVTIVDSTHNASIASTTRNSPLDTRVALQRFVLATLFYATHGNQWKDASYWLSHDHDECDWFHHANQHSHTDYVICNRYHQIHQLKLRWQGMQGTLPRELGLLSNMKRFNVGHNQLQGVLPEALWTQWKNLEELDVQHNQLTGQLPSTLGQLTNSNGLNSIILNYNQFSGTLPTEVGLLVSKVRNLAMQHNHLSGTIPTELGGGGLLIGNATLTSRNPLQLQLQSLMLNGNDFTGIIPSELGLLTQLTSLNLHHNALLEPQTLPREICNLMEQGTLETITVDCDIVNCDGCDCECKEPLKKDTTTAIMTPQTGMARTQNSNNDGRSLLRGTA